MSLSVVAYQFGLKAGNNLVIIHPHASGNNGSLSKKLQSSFIYPVPAKLYGNENGTFGNAVGSAFGYNSLKQTAFTLIKLHCMNNKGAINDQNV